MPIFMQECRRSLVRGLVLAGLAVPVSLLGNAVAGAQEKPALPNQAKAMLVLDASGSMWGQLQGKSKIEIARDVVGGLMANWDPAIELGLMAYGHRRTGDCADIETILPAGAASAGQIATMIRRIQPKGKTPLSLAVATAAASLRYTEEPATVILVTDGLETCEADPCAMARQLEESGVAFTAHVIGFDVKESESASLRCIAERTGGKYFTALTASELQTALSSIVKATKPPAHDRVRLALVENGPLLEEGDAAFAFHPAVGGARSGAPLASNYGYVGFAAVPPGDYVVAVSYGKASAEALVTVVGDGSEHVVVLNAGIVKLNPIIAEGTRSLSNTIKWSVFAGGDDKASQFDSLLDQGGGGRFVLPPGRYFIKGEISGVKKGFAIDVAAGDELARDVDMRSGTVNFRAVLKDGGDRVGPMPGGYFQWQAFAVGSDGKAQGEELISSRFAYDKFVLPVGPNILRFADRGEYGAVSHEAIIDVAADQTIDVGVVMNAAILNYEVVDPAGNRISGAYPYVEIYRRGTSANPDSRLASFSGVANAIYVPAEPVDIVIDLSGKRSLAGQIEPAAGETISLKLVLRPDN